MSQRRRRVALFGAAIVVLVLGIHVPFLKLPFFWDEAGQFIPAALDLYRNGDLVARSAIPNVHPPGVMLYLAAVWRIVGFSVAATRLAMLLMAAAAVFVCFLLAVELCRGVPGIPGFLAVVFLLASPIFYTQAMMAQLDMPAMAFTVLAFLLFLKERHVWAAWTAVALVMMKETGVLTPLVFLAALVWEKRLREAAWYLLPVAAVALWTLVVLARTGSAFGSAEFGVYNVEYLFHPVRASVALVRRVYHLFFENFHFLGTLGIAFGMVYRNPFQGRRWGITAWLIGVHVVAFSFLGGAMLERYLLPVLPLTLIAMAAGLCSSPLVVSVGGTLALTAGLIWSNFWNPPYPFPYENNLAMTDFVRLHQTAAGFVEQNYPNAYIATAWPLTAAFQNPRLGYVSFSHTVIPLYDFTPYSVGKVPRGAADVFVVYSREWTSPRSWMKFPLVEKFWRRFFGYQPQVSAAEIEARLGMRQVGMWSQNGQWIIVLAARTPRPPAADLF
ncbi:MAG: ArnT family glycosyltransferase [Bryobacteraceae bacterium]